MGGSPSKDAQQMANREWNGSGKVAIVTGPMGTGIGFHTARFLAERGCHVVLAGRSAERLSECVNLMRAACKNADGSVMEAEQVQLTPLVLDLSSLRSVEEFADNFKALNLPLNILLNNAGTMATPYQQTKDGFEIQFGTNHLGHFYLTQLLMPQLQAAQPARIVNVASMAHKMASMDASKLDACFRPSEKEYNSWVAYGNSKLANMLSARSFQAKYGATGVTAYSVHPGVVATELGRQGMLTRAIYKFLAFTMKTAEDGAATTLYAATSPEALENAGGYFDCCALATPTKSATDDALAEALWVRSEEEIAAWKAKQ